MLIGNYVSDLEVHVTDDPAPWDKSDTVANPQGGLVKQLATRPSPELDRPFYRTLTGEGPVEDLAGLTHLARVVTTTADGKLVSAGQLEGQLTLGGFDVPQVVMGIRGVNARQPRSFYPM
jgi:hypothetical protein